MSESFEMPVLLTGTTISVMAMDKHCRIRNDTTMPKNPIIPKTTRCGSSVPVIHEWNLSKNTNEWLVITDYIFHKQLLF